MLLLDSTYYTTFLLKYSYICFNLIAVVVKRNSHLDRNSKPYEVGYPCQFVQNLVLRPINYDRTLVSHCYSVCLDDNVCSFLYFIANNIQKHIHLVIRSIII